MRVAGSRVLITGAGQGLGLAIASEFVQAGAQVILTDLSAERLAQAHERSAGHARLPFLSMSRRPIKSRTCGRE